MTTLFIRHKVKDYAAWKQVYDAYDRKGDGCTRATVHRDADDPNLVVVTESFPDIATARAHANSEKLKATMGRAGVAGPPEIWFSEDVEERKLLRLAVFTAGQSSDRPSLQPRRLTPACS